MSKAIPGGDTLPWYRQFWPWFLILLPASVVVAAISTVVIANRHADDLVVDDYYKDGLAINRQLEKIERAKGLGITATLGIQDTHLTVILQGAPDRCCVAQGFSSTDVPLLRLDPLLLS